MNAGDHFLRAAVLRRDVARRGRARMAHPRLCAHARAAEDPDHAGADEHRRRGAAHVARGDAVRKPVQGQPVDLAVRLDVPCIAGAGAPAPSALFHRAGVVLGGLDPALRHLRRIGHGRRSRGTLGAAFCGGAHPLHFDALGSPDAGAAPRNRPVRPVDEVSRPHRHHQSEGVRARPDLFRLAALACVFAAVPASVPGRAVDCDLSLLEAAARAGRVLQPRTQPGRQPARTAPHHAVGGRPGQRRRSEHGHHPSYRAAAEALSGDPDPGSRVDGERARPSRPTPRCSRRSVFRANWSRGGRTRRSTKLGELLGKYRSLKVYLDACVHCGACTDKCHYFLGTGDPKNMPVARQDLLRKVYRRYFTWAGKTVSETGRRRGSDQGSARRLVLLFLSVLGMPPLLGVLSLRHRHRRNHHGGERDHGLDRPGTELHQRDHRQGAQASATTWG